MISIISIQFPKDLPDRQYLSKEYSYLTDLTDIVEGDMVIVDTQFGYRVAKVSSLFGDESKANKWVVCSVNTKAFESKLANLKHKQFVMHQVKQRVESQGFIAQARALAENDPVLKKLLASIDNTLPDLLESDQKEVAKSNPGDF